MNNLRYNCPFKRSTYTDTHPSAYVFMKMEHKRLRCTHPSVSIPFFHPFPQKDRSERSQKHQTSSDYSLWMASGGHSRRSEADVSDFWHLPPISVPSQENSIPTIVHAWQSICFLRRMRLRISHAPWCAE